MVVSDGVTEALDDGEREFDLGQLGALTTAHAGQPAAALAAAVVEAVRAHRGVRQDQDDVTVLVTRRRSA